MVNDSLFILCVGAVEDYHFGWAKEIKSLLAKTIDKMKLVYYN